jgi:hypothetical protein
MRYATALILQLVLATAAPHSWESRSASIDVRKVSGTVVPHLPAITKREEEPLDLNNEIHDVFVKGKEDSYDVATGKWRGDAYKGKDKPPITTNNSNCLKKLTCNLIGILAGKCGEDVVMPC